MKLTNFYLLLFPIILLTACAGQPAESTPTTISTQVIITSTPTPTIIWFPATDTPTFIPTSQAVPTSDQRQGLSDLLFTDTFDQPGLWNTSASSFASSAVALNRLALSITGQGPSTLLSLRNQPALADFYAEATATISLCAGKDQFGIVFHASPGDNDYRFMVSCNGAVRLGRTTSGSLLPLNDWLSTGDAPIGAPAEVKLGVWVAGEEMRFFLNDQFQFSFRDKTFHPGTLGFFAYVIGSAPIIVSFSNLSVYSVIYTPAIPTLLPTLTLLPSLTPSK